MAEDETKAPEATATEPAPDEDTVEETATTVTTTSTVASRPRAVAEPGAEPVGRPGRKVREGTVVSDKMQSTVVVAVVERVRHRRYGKTVQRTTKLYAHDTGFEARVGDRVRVAETRPLSKLKRWRVTDVLERAR